MNFFKDISQRFRKQVHDNGYFYNLDPDPRPGPWTLDPDPKNLDPENLDHEKPGPWKTWNKYRIKNYVWL